MSNQHYHARLFKEIRSLDKEDVIHLYKNHILLDKELNEAEKILSHLIYSEVEFHEMFNSIMVHLPATNKAGKPVRKVLLDFLLELKKNDVYLFQNSHYSQNPEDYEKL